MKATLFSSFFIMFLYFLANKQEVVKEENKCVDIFCLVFYTTSKKKEKAKNVK